MFVLDTRMWKHARKDNKDIIRWGQERLKTQLINL